MRRNVLHSAAVAAIVVARAIARRMRIALWLSLLPSAALVPAMLVSIPLVVATLIAILRRRRQRNQQQRCEND